jgi:hypothetical protein
LIVTDRERNGSMRFDTRMGLYGLSGRAQATESYPKGGIGTE